MLSDDFRFYMRTNTDLESVVYKYVLSFRISSRIILDRLSLIPVLPVRDPGGGALAPSSCVLRSLLCFSEPTAQQGRHTGPKSSCWVEAATHAWDDSAGWKVLSGAKISVAIEENLARRYDNYFKMLGHLWNGIEPHSVQITSR